MDLIAAILSVAAQFIPPGDAQFIPPADDIGTREGWTPGTQLIDPKGG